MNDHYSLILYLPPDNHLAMGLAMYYIVAINEQDDGTRLPNRQEASRILALKLEYSSAHVTRWFRGDFSKHPLTSESFLEFAKIYRGQPGLDNDLSIYRLARAGGQQYVDCLCQLGISGKPSPFSTRDLKRSLGHSQTFGGALGFDIFLRAEARVGLEKALNIFNQKLPEGPKKLAPDLYRALNLAYVTLSSELQQCFRALGGLKKRDQYDLRDFAALWDTSSDDARKILSQFARDVGFLEIKEAENTQLLVPQWAPEIQTYARWVLDPFHQEKVVAETYEERLSYPPSCIAKIKAYWKETKLKNIVRRSWGRAKKHNPIQLVSRAPYEPPAKLIEYTPLDSELWFLPYEIRLVVRAYEKTTWPYTVIKILANLLLTFYVSFVLAVGVSTWAQNINLQETAILFSITALTIVRSMFLMLIPFVSIIVYWGFFSAALWCWTVDNLEKVETM